VCVGDCGGDGAVTIDELVTAVNIALDRAPLSGCQSLDADGDGRVAVDELIAAVNETLMGACDRWPAIPPRAALRGESHCRVRFGRNHDHEPSYPHAWWDPSVRPSGATLVAGAATSRPIDTAVTLIPTGLYEGHREAHRSNVVLFVAAALVMPVLEGITARASRSPPRRLLPSRASLTALDLPHTTITSATSMSTWPCAEPCPEATPTGAPPPTYCKVEAVVKPARGRVQIGEGRRITIEVWMPSSGWNRKFQGVGNGAFAGSIPRSSMCPALKAGYATAGTDTGHGGPSTPAGRSASLSSSPTSAGAPSTS
jgi:hypothetical protein